MKNLKTVTAKELRMLRTIKEHQSEDGYSELESTDVHTKSNAGVVSSLSKKGLIYDSYALEDFTNKKSFKMWCLTGKGIEIVGKPDFLG